MTTHLLHITGMHCKACPMLVESELADVQGVKTVKASLKDNTVQVTGDLDYDVQSIIAKLEPVLKPHGYSLSVEKSVRKVEWRQFLIAGFIALGFLGLFLLLQKAGIVNLVNVQSVSYPTAFLIGVVASLSTCMAVVGGLTLSVSSNFAKEGDKVTPQVLFHAGRLFSFFVLGGAIGALGASFELGSTGMLVLNTLVGLIMLVLGVNLLDIFHFTKKLQPALPPFIARHVSELKHLNHTLTPALLGIATFFLPCGFTQSMQVYALSTGSFLTGGLIMLSFAVGTFPVLAALSFASLSLHSLKASGIFFKTAGLVVISFAIINLFNALVVAGIISPFGRL